MLAVMFASREELFTGAVEKFLNSTEISDTKPEERPLILDIVD